MNNLPYFNIDGLLFLLRWFHIYMGVIWIGLLYYFNFVQGSFMKEAAAPAKPEVLGKLLPRAMWWFRWGAFWTMASGAALILINRVQIGSFNNSWGVTIGTGAIMGLIMGANVWFVIHPAQKLVIANAQQTAGGGAALPGVAEAAARGLLASRTNTFLSVPMLFFMAASRHLVLPVTDSSNYTLYWIVALAILVVIEGNALKGKLGPIETVKGVITSGFVLTAVYAILMAVIL
jgi:uncharacterized membrane protein